MFYLKKNYLIYSSYNTNLSNTCGYVVGQYDVGWNHTVNKFKLKKTWVCIRPNNKSENFYATMPQFVDILQKINGHAQENSVFGKN